MLLKFIKKICIWIIIIFIISVIIFAFKSANTDYPRGMLFADILIMTFLISSFSAFTGYSLSRLLRGKLLSIEIPTVLSGVLLISFLANLLSYFILNVLLDHKTYSSIFDHLIIVLLISVTVTVLTLIIEYLNLKKIMLENDLNSIKEKIQNEKKEQSLSIKEDERYHLIKFDTLIYLASHGKKTTLHTVEKDFAVNQLLKEIEIKLPQDKFIRVHKQFIINSDFLKQIKYFEGGRYTVYLNDEDESIIPVSRNMVPVLKEKYNL
jgi:DNA-binding LytR/AlgR family response regulator